MIIVHIDRFQIIIIFFRFELYKIEKTKGVQETRLVEKKNFASKTH